MILRKIMCIAVSDGVLLGRKNISPRDANVGTTELMPERIKNRNLRKRFIANLQTLKDHGHVIRNCNNQTLLQKQPPISQG